VLFNDSVRANLTLGRQADDATLWQALEIAQLQDIIAALPHGLDTVVDGRGCGCPVANAKDWPSHA